jgi:hypothetical protein
MVEFISNISSDTSSDVETEDDKETDEGSWNNKTTRIVKETNDCRPTLRN